MFHSTYTPYEKAASAGNRTRIYCLEGNNANLYTTDAVESSMAHKEFIWFFPNSSELTGLLRPACNVYLQLSLWRELLNAIFYVFLVTKCRVVIATRISLLD